MKVILAGQTRTEKNLNFIKNQQNTQQVQHFINTIIQKKVSTETLYKFTKLQGIRKLAKYITLCTTKQIY